jgi:type I thyroxine 5'-deiodinase
VDGWQMPSNIEDKILVASAHSFEERDTAANVCVVKLGIKIPALVDDINDTTEIAYTGWPDRLYVVGSDGRIAYKSAPGPYGFKPKEVEKTLQRLVTPSAK